MTFILRHKSHELAAWAGHGDIEPFAQYIEEGGELDRHARKWIADYLRGVIKLRRGNRRLPAQIEREWQAVRGVLLLKCSLRCSEYKAISIYLEQNPDMNRDTLKAWLRKRRVRK